MLLGVGGEDTRLELLRLNESIKLGSHLRDLTYVKGLIATLAEHVSLLLKNSQVDELITVAIRVHESLLIVSAALLGADPELTVIVR